MSDGPKGPVHWLDSTAQVRTHAGCSRSKAIEHARRPATRSTAASRSALVGGRRRQSRRCGSAPRRPALERTRFGGLHGCGRSRAEVEAFLANRRSPGAGTRRPALWTRIFLRVAASGIASSELVERRGRQSIGNALRDFSERLVAAGVRIRMRPVTAPHQADPALAFGSASASGVTSGVDPGPGDTNPRCWRRSSSGRRLRPKSSNRDRGRDSDVRAAQRAALRDGERP